MCTRLAFGEIVTIPVHQGLDFEILVRHLRTLTAIIALSGIRYTILLLSMRWLEIVLNLIIVALPLRLLILRLEVSVSFESGTV